jgi:tetratricopeptide (TPR) repeat protein
MKKYIFIYAIILTSCLPVFAQPTESQFIDSLKKQSIALKGAEKVDCLNLLARTISIAGNTNWKQKADSVYKFASIAYEESKKQDYRKGLAFSLTNLALSEYLKGLDLRINKKNDDEATLGMEKYLSQSIPIAEQAGDHETLGNAYELWGDMLYQKSKSADNDSQAKYSKKSMEQFALAGNIKREGEVCTWLSESYYNRGYYEDAFDYCNMALRLNEKALSLAKTKEEKSYRIYLYWQSLVDLGDLYKTAGDYSTSLNYFNKSEQFALANEPDLYDPTLKAGIFRLNGNYDSSFYYINKAFKEDPDAPLLKVSLGETYLLTQNYDSALVFTQQAMPALRKRNVNGRILIQPLLIMGSAYSGKKEYTKAMPYARGMGYAKKLGTRP